MLKRKLSQIVLFSLASGLGVDAAIADSCSNNCNVIPVSSPWRQNGVGPGFYLGFGVGYATNNGANQQAITLNPPPATTLATPKGKQFGSRVYIGYKMNQIASIEFGGTFFSTINYDTKGVQTCTGATDRIRDLELLGKAEVGFYTLSLFGKLGAAVVYQTPSGAFNTPLPGATCGQNQYNTKVNPVFAVGASYNLTQRWVVDVTATRLQTGGIASSMNFYSAGLSYHFADVYCGQFLCDD